MSIHAKPLKILANYPRNILVALIVDGWLLSEDQYAWVSYDRREPGCLRAAFDALAYAISGLENNTLELSTIRRLHAHFTNLVEFSKEKERYIKPGRFREGGECFNISSKSATKEGLKELLQSIKNQPIDTLGARLESNDKLEKYDAKSLANVEIDDQLINHILNKIARQDYLYHAVSVVGIKLEQEVQKLIDRYNQQIKTAASDDDKLNVIIELIYDLEHIHPFFEANLRTFGIGLMTRLLMQNGFAPATFENPNRFDAYSKKELLQEVKNAIALTEEIVNGKKEIFSYPIDSRVPDTCQNMYSEIIGSFVYQIKFELQQLDKSSKPVEMINAIQHTLFSSEKNDKMTEIESTEMKDRLSILDNINIQIHNEVHQEQLKPNVSRGSFFLDLSKMDNATLDWFKDMSKEEEEDLFSILNK